MEALKKQKDEEVQRKQREVEVQKEALLKMQTESEGNNIQWEEEEEEGKGTQVLHITYLCEFIIFFFGHHLKRCLKTSVVKPSRQDIQHVSTCL